MTTAKSSSIQLFPLVILCKSIAISGLLLFLFYTFLFQHPINNYQTSDFFPPFQLKWSANSTNISISNNDTYPTNVSHIGFVIIGSVTTWNNRKPYIEAWWRPNSTRGYLYLDKEPTEELLPWPSSTSPPFKVNTYTKVANEVHVRMFSSILDMCSVGDENLRWLIVCDDDTLFMVDNLVEVLGKYDHTKYHYIGGNSECVKSNGDFSFDMAFGGAGYALSYPLAKELAKQLDSCIDRYPYLFVSDQMAQTCLADLGVSLTIEKGIHQIDLVSDISGFLSAHPQSPFLTMHHFEKVDPIFPSMNRFEAVNHLMKSANVDQSRMLQQTICYKRDMDWSFSVSWGYSAQVYEKIIPRNILHKPLQTFRPWSDEAVPPFFMFNTRWPVIDSCESPHMFFLESVEYNSKKHQVLTTYARSYPRNLPPCDAAGNHSADDISKIQVLSPAKLRKTAGVIECCDVENEGKKDVMKMKIRSCLQGEVIA